jgi:pimeloyl-ACP methyl ester carboxylesterase
MLLQCVRRPQAAAAAAALVFLFLGASMRTIPAAAAAPAPAVSRVSVETRDGWKISGLYHPPRRRLPVAILIHGAESGKGEWEGFSPMLWERGFGTLAIDLRGHGESKAGPRGREDFQSALNARRAWPSAEEDLRAAVREIRRVAPASPVGMIGASIGANLASVVFQEDRRIAWLVLLSPGIEYRDVRLALPPRGPVAVAASPADAYAFASARALAAQSPNVKFFKGSTGHGVQMFADARFASRILAWIERASKSPKSGRAPVLSTATTRR